MGAYKHPSPFAQILSFLNVVRTLVIATRLFLHFLFLPIAAKQVF
jgi:hypothetical protein